MDTIGIDDNEVIMKGLTGVWALFVEHMSKLNLEAEVLESYVFEIIPVSFLYN